MTGSPSERSTLHSIRSRAEAFILAGGRSSRFGSDKALALWRGRPLLARALDAVRPLGIPVRVVTRDPHLYAAWCRCFVTREMPDRGPVEGARAALASCGAPWAFLLAVDMPGVTAAHLRRLWQEAEAASREPAAAVVFEHGGRIHPFPGLYARQHVERIRRLPPGASMQEFLGSLPAKTVGSGAAPEGLVTALRNVNVPGDLEAS